MLTVPNSLTMTIHKVYFIETNNKVHTSKSSEEVKCTNYVLNDSSKSKIIERYSFNPHSIKKKRFLHKNEGKQQRCDRGFLFMSHQRKFSIHDLYSRGLAWHLKRAFRKALQSTVQTGLGSHYYAAITSIILQSTRVPLGIEASISTKNLDCEAVTLTRQRTLDTSLCSNFRRAGTARSSLNDSCTRKQPFVVLPSNRTFKGREGGLNLTKYRATLVPTPTESRST